MTSINVASIACIALWSQVLRESKRETKRLIRANVGIAHAYGNVATALDVEESPHISWLWLR